MSADATSDEPASHGLGSWTGADGELFLRADAVMDLGAGLHELAALAERHVTELDKLSAVDAASSSRAAQLLPSGLRDSASAKFVSLTEDFRQQLQDQLDALDPDTVTDVQDPFEWVLSLLSSPFTQGIASARTVLSELPTGDLTVFRYLIQLGLASDRRSRLTSIRRALLITVVASAEISFRGVLHRLVFNRDGGSWGLPEHDQVVSRLMKGGIESWEQNLSGEGFELDLPGATCDWPSVKEIWARRHVLVHSGGLADERYIRRVPGATRGVVLEVDGGYLCNAIDLVCGFILGVIILAWARLSPGNRAYVLQLACAYAAAADGEQRWPLAETLHMLAARLDDELTEAAVHHVNTWFARIRWRGQDSVHADVSRWDTADLPPVFGLAKQILLGHREEAIAMLPSLMAQGEVSQRDLNTWPLFDSIREEPAVQLLLRN